MTDVEIDKALALAIGWKPEQIWTCERYLLLLMRFDGFEHRQRFSYKDWNVIGPIAERYDCFPKKANFGGWVNNLHVYTTTPQRAIALAVIGVEK